MSDYYVCPLCNKPGERSPRYPKCICVECGHRATDEAGRAVQFSNQSFSAVVMLHGIATLTSHMTATFVTSMAASAGRTKPTWAAL